MSSDGCSGFQWVEWLFGGVRDCCAIHDVGGTDGQLLDCLQTALPSWGWPIAAALVALMVLLRPIYNLIENLRPKGVPPMLPTLDQLRQIAGGPIDESNANSVLGALMRYGPDVELTPPHRLAHFLPQTMHESGRYRYDRELWNVNNPTAAQARYDTRTDLGNTPEKDGDGYKNRGRGPIQVTGGYNIAAYEAWCVQQGWNPPDFTANPDLINTDPWEGLSAIWYWSVGNPTGKSLNRYADENNIIQITKKINGGLNGFDDRLNLYVRTALVLLHYAPDDVRSFQKNAQARGYLPADTADVKQVDGDPGPLTLAALHRSLVDLRSPIAVSDPIETKSSPVVEEVSVLETPKGADKTLGARLWGAAALLGQPFVWFGGLDLTGKLVVGSITVAAIGFLLFRGELIAARVRSLVKAFGA